MGSTVIREDREYRTACAVCRVTDLHVLPVPQLDVSVPILDGHSLRPKSLVAKTARPNPWVDNLLHIGSHNICVAI